MHILHSTSAPTITSTSNMTKAKLSIILAALMLPLSAATVDTNEFEVVQVSRYSCKLCGENEVIGAPDAAPMVDAPEYTCAILQELGDAGQLPEPICRELQDASGACECKTVDTNEFEVVQVSRYTCKLCGENEVIGAPDAAPMVDAPEYTCAILQELGDAGQLPEPICRELQDASGACECKTVDTNEFGVDTNEFEVAEVSEPSCQLCPVEGETIFVSESDKLSVCSSLKELFERQQDLDLDACSELQLYFAAFECKCAAPSFGETESTPSPTASPSASPTAAPTASPTFSNFFSSEHEVCNLCGEGHVMGAPDVAPISGAENTSCNDLQMRGSGGYIPAGICYGFQNLVRFQQQCQCQVEERVTDIELEAASECIGLFLPCSSSSDCCDQDTVCDGICTYPKKDYVDLPGSKLYDREGSTGSSTFAGQGFHKDDRGGIRRRLKGN